MTKKYKILWFTNIPIPVARPGVKKEVTGSGGWLSTLATMFQREKREDYELGVCCVYPGYSNETFTEDGITYFCRKQKKYLPGAFENHWTDRPLLRIAQDVIEQWKPDLVHIHGTERFYIELVPFLQSHGIPVLVSWQGIMGACARWGNFFGTISLKAFFSQNRFFDFVLGRSLLNGFFQGQRQAKRELWYGKMITHFLGRTDFDRYWSIRLNRKAKYSHVGEILRDCFYSSAPWSPEHCHRHHIVVTAACHPRKGLECLWRAAEILWEEFPDIQINFIGNLSPNNPFGKYFIKKMNRGHCAYHLHGSCTAEQVLQHIKEAHVFVLPSLIENSPNSLGEAQLIGMPVVASDVGGISSMVESGKNGFLFPQNDSEQLAGRIREFFLSDELACAFGNAARQTALRRHDKKRIIQDLFSAYDRELKGNPL